MYRILNIITDKNIGGAGIVLLNYYSAYDKTRFTHRCVVLKCSQLSPRLKELGIDVVESADIDERSFDVHGIGAFRREIHSFKPDIVHTHASMSARIAARLNRHTRIITTRHCAYDQPASRTRFPMRQALGFINNRLSDHFIAISPAAAGNLIETGTQPKKITVMFNGVQPVSALDAPEREAARARYGIPHGAFTVLLLARFVPEKGHIYAIEAAELLRDENVFFMLAGTGPELDRMKSEVEKRKLKNVLLPGFIANTTEAHNIADIQLNCSYGTETSSLSVLEGFSLGKPAVVSDFGGNPFLVQTGVNGIVVPAHNASAAADAIWRLGSSAALYEELSKGAKHAYETKYTAEIMAGNIEKIYMEVLDGANG